VRLAGLPGGDINIINLYASTESPTRIELWEELIRVLPRDCRSVLVGDFNFVENRVDKSSICGKLIPPGEKLVFTQLTSLLGVADNYQLNGALQFTWDNKRQDGSRVMARLDRIYAFQGTAPGAEPVEEYLIKGDSVHSDHLAVWCKLTLLPEPKRLSAYKMSTLYLKDKEVRRQVENIWRANPNLQYFGRLRKCIKFYKEYCIQKARDRRCTETDLRQRLAAALLALQGDPTNSKAQSQVSELADSLQGLERISVEGQKVRSRIKWMRVGDSGSKEFFKAHKQHTGASRIISLDDEGGAGHSAQAELEIICREYYSKLYKGAPASREQEGAREQALASIGDRLSAEMKTRLQAPIGLSEVEEALKGMASGKSPGLDGVVIEFYKVFWELIGEEFHRMVLRAINLGRLPPGVTNGLISLLHKGGVRGQLTNWRPITLLNVGYKLFAKVLQLRLQPVLMEIISPDQSAFLPLRFILDNVLLTHETLEWAEYSN
jgi:hypothetical protein